MLRVSGYYTGLEWESRQLRDEGRPVPEGFDDKVKSALSEKDAETRNRLALELYETARKAPEVDMGAKEPNDIEGIRRLAHGNGRFAVDSGRLYDKCRGGWLARAAGCLLGKPVEGWRTPELKRFLSATGNLPITHYLSKAVPDDLKKEIEAIRSDAFCSEAFIDDVSYMPEDDDTNYTVLGVKLLEERTRDFTSEDVADEWLASLPYHRLCTAEDITYRNLLNLKSVPQTAVFCNAYREWIGAQIRGDVFGYVNPGDTAAAAEMAWRDARISHVKNGIYGEMWAAAMIAAAYALDEMPAVIRAGVNEIPRESRLAVAIENILKKFESGKTADEVFADIAARWDEYSAFDWCHTVSNAEIVAAALLYGEKDLEKTFSLSVTQGFDTDCNAATAGSVLGVMLGADALPEKWIAPLNDRIITGVHRYGDVRISDMARRCVALTEK